MNVVVSYPPLHCIVYGDPGSRKSTFASTFPKPLLVKQFDANGKEFPYRKWGRNHSSGRASETEGVTEYGVRFLDIVAPNGEWIRIEYFNDLSPESGAWEKIEWDVRERAFFTHGWETVVLDSLTFLNLVAFYHAKFVVNPNSKEPRQWHAWATDALERMLLVQLQNFPTNLVVLAHIDHDKDEVLNTYVRQLSAPGRLKTRNELCAGYAEFYRAYAVPDANWPDGMAFLLQTQKDANFNCASQIGAPNPCIQDYHALWENWDK